MFILLIKEKFLVITESVSETRTVPRALPRRGDHGPQFVPPPPPRPVSGVARVGKELRQVVPPAVEIQEYGRRVGSVRRRRGEPRPWVRCGDRVGPLRRSSKQQTRHAGPGASCDVADLDRRIPDPGRMRRVSPWPPPPPPRDRLARHLGFGISDHPGGSPYAHCTEKSGCTSFYGRAGQASARFGHPSLPPFGRAPSFRGVLDTPVLVPYGVLGGDARVCEFVFRLVLGLGLLTALGTLFS